MQGNSVVLASAVGCCYYYCSYCIVFDGVASLLCSFHENFVFFISLSLGSH